MSTRAPIAFPFEEAPAPGEAREVADGILWIRMPLPFVLDHVNLYALDEGDSWTVIDAGIFSSKSRQLWEAVLQGPLGKKPVSRLVLTHHHPDHVGAAGWLKSQHGAEILASRTGSSQRAQHRPTPSSAAPVNSNWPS